jgi:hypothetical protein
VLHPKVFVEHSHAPRYLFVSLHLQPHVLVCLNGLSFIMFKFFYYLYIHFLQLFVCLYVCARFLIVSLPFEFRRNR